MLRQHACARVQHVVLMNALSFERVRREGLDAAPARVQLLTSTDEALSTHREVREVIPKHGGHLNDESADYLTNVCGNSHNVFMTQAMRSGKEGKHTQPACFK